MKIALARALIRLLSLLPLRLLHALAIPLGWTLNALPSRKHTVIDTHLKLAFPAWNEAEIRRLRRHHWVEMARLVLESGAAWHWSGPRLLAHMPVVDGWQHVEAAQASPNGYLMVSAHLGNWEIMSLYATLCQPVAYLYKAPKAPKLDALITASRQRFGGQLIASGSPAMRQLLIRLKHGGGIGLLADQQPKQGEGRFVPFFGVPALTMTLVHRLARHTGCTVLLGSCRRLPRGQGFALTIEPADMSMYGDDEQAALIGLHDWLETRIRQAPAQYLWSYKRYSIRPAGEENLYPPRR